MVGTGKLPECVFKIAVIESSKLRSFHIYNCFGVFFSYLFFSFFKATLNVYPFRVEHVSRVVQVFYLTGGVFWNVVW